MAKANARSGLASKVDRRSYVPPVVGWYLVDQAREPLTALLGSGGRAPVTFTDRDDARAVRTALLRRGDGFFFLRPVMGGSDLERFLHPTELFPGIS